MVMRKPVLDAVEHPVGLVALEEDFERRTLDKKVNVVGIVGMGDCGKTTLATETFNRKSSVLLGSIFLLDVGKAAQESGLGVLKNQMLEDLLGRDDATSFDDTRESKRIVALANQLKSSRVLIVLDGIDDILVAKVDSLKGEYRELTSDLVWLRWQDCTYPSIPSWVSLENMRILEINGVFDKLWSSHVKQPRRLRELIVLGGIRKLPKAIGELQQLTKIIVDGYLNTSLEDLPEEFCNLKSLERLTLRTSLPTNLGKLVNLKHLDLGFNSGLKALPPSFNQLIGLEHLDLESCSNLVILPQFLGRITSLQFLSFKECRKLKALPSQVPCQLSLKSLNLAGTSLEEIPSEIGRLINLKVLDLGSLYLTSL